MILTLNANFIEDVLSSSSNVLVNYCYSLVLNGSSSNVCNSLNVISHLYDLDRYNVNNKDMSKLVVYSDEQCLIKGGILNDLISFSDNNPFDSNVRSLIDNICTE